MFQVHHKEKSKLFRQQVLEKIKKIREQEEEAWEKEKKEGRNGEKVGYNIWEREREIESFATSKTSFSFFMTIEFRIY